jgi:YVTN family beta-propeller protein
MRKRELARGNHARKGCAVLAFATVAVAAQAAPPLAYVTSETGGVGVIDLDALTLTRTYPTGADGPRGLSLADNGRHLLVANKKTGELALIDTHTGEVVKRVKIGMNPEFVRVHGRFAYVTYEPGETEQAGGAGGTGGAPGGKDDDDANRPPAEIAMVDLKSFQVLRSIKSGHETEGMDFSRDGKLMAVTNEGDDTVSVYQTATGKQVKSVSLPKGGRPRGIRLSPDGQHWLVTLENTGKLIELNAHTYQIGMTVDTKLGPYGLAYDPAGKRLFVAAARDSTLQVFDAKTYRHLADIPVGKRCWHFSFTPDGSKIVMACGRSNAVLVFDANSYQPVKEISGLPLAWGVVTWPRSKGSIE